MSANYMLDTLLLIGAAWAALSLGLVGCWCILRLIFGGGGQ